MRQLKLLLAGLILLFTSIITKADQSDTSKVNVSTVYHDVKNGIDINAPKIEQAIGSIAKDLKVTADQVWHILVKQQRVWSYCFLLLTLSALTNWYFFYKYNNFNLKEDKYNIISLKNLVVNPNYSARYTTDESNPKFLTNYKEEVIPHQGVHIKWFRYIHLIFCLILSVESYLHFASMLTGFLNPEFGAMQTIAEVAHSLK